MDPRSSAGSEPRVPRCCATPSRRHRARAWLLVACLIAVACSAFVSACASPPSTPTSTKPNYPTPSKPLYPGEVLQYQGAKLSSIEDFYENSIKGPQKVNAKTYRLSIHGRVQTPLSLTYDEVLARQTYSKVVTLDCVEGWSVNILWDGVLLTDLLEQAGADMTSSILIFRAVDGYSTSLPLDYIKTNKILLASKMNGVVMPPERGYPFMVVAEDRWGYKWCKWVKDIEVSNDQAFKGYWESRGYSNGGERDQPSTD